MRRVLFVALGLSIVLVLPRGGQAQDTDSKTIIDEAIKAIGGLEKVKKLEKGAIIAKAKGNVEAMGAKIDFTLDAYNQPPHKSKVVINVMFMGMTIEVIRVIDGDKGWQSAMGMVMDVEKEAIDEHRAMEHVESVTNLYVLTTDKAIKLSPLGESKVGDTPVVGIQVSKKDKRDVNLYFDKKTHLLLKAEYRAVEQFSKMEVAQEKIYSDYKELVPGIKMASKQLINNDGKRYMELEMTEITPVERHDDSLFKKPD